MGGERIGKEKKSRAKKRRNQRTETRRDKTKQEKQDETRCCSYFMEQNSIRWSGEKDLPRQRRGDNVDQDDTRLDR